MEIGNVKGSGGAFCLNLCKTLHIFSIYENEYIEVDLTKLLVIKK